MSRRSMALLATALFSLFAAGCGGTKPMVAPLAQEFEMLRRDARAQQPVAGAKDLLSEGEARAAEAEAARLKKQDQVAAAAYTRGIADARAALAASVLANAEEQAAQCRESVELARQQWEKAIRQLEQTEGVAGKRASGVSRTAPAQSAAEPDLPTGHLNESTPAGLDEARIRSEWQAWSGAANHRAVPISDLEVRIERALTASRGEKVKPAEREQSFHVAYRAVQEAEARVRERWARETCGDAAAAVGALADARGEALRAMIQMERELRDDLRAELEKTRAEAQNRQSEMYEALHALEGKLLSIRQDARGTIVSLADILFDFDKATLKRDVEFGLVKIATILAQFPEMRIQVEGHTDNVGKPDYNLDLSRRRAKAVHDFLAQQGVAAERMTVEGYGMTQPVADNATEEGRAKNRRVDLVIQESQ
ncbi:MAG: OmpA family protein [Candidatus Eisenbacteria bacterium]|nr:OmpA family protein [Candidatus Eisenbacteria bacterium]